ncbi:hypothetical protein L6164_022972 [Bauhinia variegata]|uniref:Uncharacterized protein n=1 Tax=Bauhinia variegata TaxID=167791 RepID=A0ACB9MI50_BAUVA|nr:hypothetical protein L6164_022972 [Bauhinia variegata]
MASIPESLESSLPVPSVQELAIQRPDIVPLRYIRDDVDDITTVASDPNLRVPLIDVAKLVNTETQEKELQKLHLACKDWETLESYSEDMRELATSIVKFITMALGLESPQISESFQEGQYDIRMNCYPPCPEPEQFLKDDKWVFVEPIQGAIVTNIGQITEVISNGIYKAPVHRAVVNKWKERLSIVTFCYPSASIDIGPAQKLIGEGNPPVYSTLTHAEYFHRFFNRKLEESFIDSLKI